MDEDQPGGHDGLQRQIDDLQRQMDDLLERVTRDQADIDSLEARADRGNHRADATEARADRADVRANASEARSGDDHRRIADIESRLDVDEKIIAELQADGLISHDHAVHLQEALRTSRMIGAAIGMVMATRGVSEVEAFALLSRTSQNSNRKVRVLAEEVVDSGDVSRLLSA